MRYRSKTPFIYLALAIGLLASHSARAEDQKPCLKIKEACEQAGFKQGAVGDGLGLQIDCIRPIIEGGLQRKAASQPLPSVDAAVVAACKAKNPTFGKPKLNGQSGPVNSGSDY